MKIGILTSSRADFGIYYPLVKKLWNDKFFKVEIIAFGAHLKKEFGNTADEIIKLGFDIKHKVETITKNKTEIEIAQNIGDTILKFSKFWNENKFDLVFALGDRYEMFGAVTAASPFNITFAHIHAGETTLGAIDNSYRHSISLMSKYLFVTTAIYKKRAIEIIKRSKDVFNVGALSIDNLVNQELYSIEEFYKVFKIDLTKQSILITFHPETIATEKNKEFIEILIQALSILKDRYQLIITMPNADTRADIIRTNFTQFGRNTENVQIVESFGMKGYLTCLKNVKLLIGNTSSGFVEAAYFPKWVINIGNRQDGRIITPNIYSIPVNKDQILEAVKQIENKIEMPNNCNVYGIGKASIKIIKILKKNGLK